MKQSPPGSAAIVWRGSGEVRLGGGSADWVAIGMAICADRGDPGNARDIELMDTVGRAAGDNLVELLGGAPPPDVAGDSTEPADEGIEAGTYRIAPDHARWSLALRIGAQALILLRSRGAQSGRAPALGDLPEALADLRCGLAVHLGEAQLSAGDLAALSAGDVILFNRTTSAPVPVLVDGKYPKEGSARIEGNEDLLRISIAEAVSLQARKTMTA